MKIEINIKKNLIAAIQYHYKAVENRDAICIHSRRFEESKRRSPAVHVYIRYDGCRHVFYQDKIKEIIAEAMREIHLSEQALFAFWHRGGEKPGIHIVTASIYEDMESTMEWVKALDPKEIIANRLEKKFIFQPSELLIGERKSFYRNLRIIYGSTKLHTTFNTVLYSVVPSYRYNSVEGLNWLLGFYNMTVCVMEKEGEATKNLFYSQLELEEGEENSPICATELIEEASLKYIEGRCAKQLGQIDEYPWTAVGSRIDNLFSLTPLTLADLEKKLERYYIELHFEEDERNNTEKVWYLHRESRTILNGESIPSGNYSAASIRKRCVPEGTYSDEERSKYLKIWRPVKARTTIKTSKGVHYDIFN